ncbi:hypothetical protein Hypma_000820 [Hypsizygus marmoreus]|uniref:Uncharacterized protein n=1 Tax=Hypsizygus marmoreus TaxID=39966 RepID=A0A369J9G7_HYPMA|nr:hypothetical protein Hypma_000820 [Hypsizygus marmoreus]
MTACKSFNVQQQLCNLVQAFIFIRISYILILHRESVCRFEIKKLSRQLYDDGPKLCNLATLKSIHKQQRCFFAVTSIDPTFLLPFFSGFSCARCSATHSRPVLSTVYGKLINTTTAVNTFSHTSIPSFFG